jgi:hypothetical protein
MGRSTAASRLQRRRASCGTASPVDIRSERQAIRPRHGAGAREPPRPGPLPQPRPSASTSTCRSTTGISRGLTDLAPPRKRNSPRSARSPACSIKTPSRHALALQPLRRQPAEDRHRQVAQPRRQALHLRRADGRRRRRHQGGDLPAVRSDLLSPGRRHPPDLVLPARGLRARRPRCMSSARGRNRSPATASMRP